MWSKTDEVTIGLEDRISTAVENSIMVTLFMRPFKFTPVKTNFGVSIVDHKGVKREFDESTHGPAFMFWANLFLRQEDYKMSAAIMHEWDKIKQRKTLGNKLRRFLGVKIKIK
jgi:hypothetical protein